MNPWESHENKHGGIVATFADPGALALRFSKLVFQMIIWLLFGFSFCLLPQCRQQLFS